MDFGELRVSLPGYQELADARIVFQIDVQIQKLKYQVWRRFSDFAALHERLAASDYAALPQLPPKTLLFSAGDKAFLEARRVLLLKYIKELLRRPDTRNSEELLTFLSLTEQTAIRSKSLRPAMVGSTGSQRFSVSSLALASRCLVAAYEDKSSMSRLGRLWTLVEPDELGQLSVWFLDPSSKIFSSSYSEKLSNKGRAVAFHAASNRILLGLDDGTVQSLEVSEVGELKRATCADLHCSPVTNFSVGCGSKDVVLSAAVDGSIRLLDPISLRIISGGRLEKRLGNHSLTCCALDTEALIGFFGTTAGVVLLYSLQTKSPQFQQEFTVISNTSINVIHSEALDLFVGCGGSIAIYTRQRDALSRREIMEFEGGSETVNSLAFDKAAQRLFAGYISFIACWCVKRCQCLLAWRAHTGGVYQLLTLDPTDCILSGGDSGTIKVWQLPPASSITLWGAQAADAEEDDAAATAAASFPVAANPQQQPYSRQQQQQRCAAAAALNERGGMPLLRRYSSSSDSEDCSPRNKQQHQQQIEEEPPLLLQQDTESSDDDELDELRSAVA